MFKKLKAGALQLVTYISVVIALLLGCFILLIHTQNQFKAKSFVLTQTIQDCDKGISYALHNSTNTKDSITLNLDTNSSISLQSEYWGTFKKISVVSKRKHIRFIKTAFIGSQRPKEKNALYLKDHNQPLVLVGNTVINGSTHLPKAGVRSGNISGQSYNREKLVDGSIKIIKQFPKLNFQHRSYIQNIQQYYASKNTKGATRIRTGDVIINSFSNPTEVYVSYEDIYLSNISVRGNIIIQSYSKILVDKTAILKDVILIAPKIELRDAVKGEFQAFANDKIIVGNNCNLEYPSALVLTKKYTDPIKPEHFIKIDSQSKVKGNIMILGRKDDQNYNPQIIIEPNATVFGEIYSELTVELKGKVYGTVYANGFTTRANGSNYQNHLLNAEINSKKLSNEYIGLPIINTKKGIAKWLY